MSEIQFIIAGQSIDRDQTAAVDETVRRIVNEGLREDFGRTALLDPSTIEVTPVIASAPTFLVTSWHETTGKVGRLQVSNSEFELLDFFTDPKIIADFDKFYGLSIAEKACFRALAATAFIADFETIIASQQE